MTPFVLAGDILCCPLRCFSVWTWLPHQAPISCMHGEGLDSENLCLCVFASSSTGKCVCQHCVVVFWVFVLRLWAAVILSGGKVNWFTPCSPLFDPTACSAVSLFSNLWPADDRTTLMRANAWQVFTVFECKHTHTHTHTYKHTTHVRTYNYIWLYTACSAHFCIICAFFMVKAVAVPESGESRIQFLNFQFVSPGHHLD